MARILGPRRAKRKPEAGLQLNRSNNFANGAIVYPMDGSQNSLGSLPAYKMALVGSPTVGKFNGASGVRCSSTSDYLNLGSHAELKSAAFTQLAIVRFDAFASVTSTISETSTTVGSSTGSAQFGVDTATGRLLLVYDNHYIVSESIASGPKVTVGKTFVAAVSYDGTNAALALDGCDVSSTTTTAPFGTGGTTFLLSKKGDSQESARPCEIYLFAAWPRALSRAELVELTRDPYQLFTGAKSTLALPAQAPGTSGTSSTSQGQTSAASAALSSAAGVASSQAQSVTAAGGISSAASGATKQGQSVAASVAISVSATTSASQAQSAQAAASTATDGATSSSQAQSAAGTGATSDALSAEAMTGQAQSVVATGSIGANAQISTNQGQQALASVGISASVAITSQQGQSVAALAAIAIDARGATSQAQSIGGARFAPGTGTMTARIRIRPAVGAIYKTSAAVRGRTDARPA